MSITTAATANVLSDILLRFNRLTNEYTVIITAERTTDADIPTINT